MKHRSVRVPTGSSRILDGSTSPQVASGLTGGRIISSSDHTADRNVYDLERLERVVASLVEGHRLLRRENAALQVEIDAKNRHAHRLDGKLLEANQRRQDIAKRIDELIAQIDQLGAQLDSQAESLGE